MHSFETENLARLTPDGQSRERTKGTRAKVLKWTKITREATTSKETKNNSGAVGKKHVHSEKKEKGGDRRHSKGILKTKQTQWWRLIPSPAKHNDCPKLELSRVLEPPCRHYTFSLIREKAPKVFFFFFCMETKQTMDKMKKIQANLHYDSVIAILCVHRAGGLAMLWKVDIELHVQTYS